MAEESASIRIQLELANDDERLLLGLETWLELGLISDAQVRSLCAERLTCERPQPQWMSAVTALSATDSTVTRSPGTAPVFLPPEPSPRRVSTPIPRPVQSWLGQIVSELSVVWLLGLGVFLVVLSSAVLAATQWAAFSSVGQYCVLLTYTVIFWGVGLWSADNPRLQLTAKSLQIVTLLLVPLNFAAMDGLGIWQGLGWLVGLGASGLLGVIAFRLLERWSATVPQRYLFIGLGLLQLGWHWQWLPMIAIYGGVLGCGALLLRAPRTAAASTWPLLLVNLSLGLLVLRRLATLGAGTWGSLGLALGLYGAVWVWRGQRAWPPPALIAGNPDANAVLTENAASETRLIRTTALWTQRLGQGLLLLGWLMTVNDWPLQALLVSLLGFGLRIARQQTRPQRWTLLGGIAIALQFPFLIWELLPTGMLDLLVVPATWLGTAGTSAWLLGIYLYPFVVGLVAIAAAYDRRDNATMARFSEGSAVVINGLLTVISLGAPAVLVVNLIASTITAFITTQRQRLPAFERIIITHGLALVTVLVTLNHRWPDLRDEHWMLISFGLMAVNLGLSRALRAGWQRSTWIYGLGLAGLAYAQLWNHLASHDFQSYYSLLGLTIPLLMTLLRRDRWSLLAVSLTAPLTLGLAVTRLVGLGSATGMAAVQSQRRQQLPMMLVTVGFGLGFAISLIEDGLPGFPNRYDQWYGVLALLLAALWGLSLALANRSGLAALYGTACDRWGLALCSGLLLALTAEAGLLYEGWRSPGMAYAVGIALVMVAIVLRFWRRPHPVAVYLLGGGMALLAAEFVALGGGTRLTLAALIIGLGVITFGLAWVQRDRHPDLLPHLYYLTLLYGLLGVSLRVDYFSTWTGLSSLTVALLGLAVSSQTGWTWLRWLGLAGLTWGWYELVIYQLSLATGDHPADGLVVLAAVAAVIMVAYRLGASGLAARLAWPLEELVITAHIHWGIAVGLMVISGEPVYERGLGLLWPGLGLGLGLVSYSLLQGRRESEADGWIYAGLTLLVGWFAYLRLAIPALAVLDNRWGMVACGFAALFYWVPWSRLGWPRSPWQRYAMVLPPVITVLTNASDHRPTLWMLAAFYAALAWTAHQVRWSYVSAVLAVWATWLWLDAQAIADHLAYVLPLGLMGLYIAQIDPGLRTEANRAGRHWLRVVSLGLILVVALMGERWTGLQVGLAALGAIAAGLRLQVRAFLYVGTLVFGLNAINQLVGLNSEYPLIKWVVGILVGIALIAVAADFERRREQWIGLTQTWLDQLQSWQ